MKAFIVSNIVVLLTINCLIEARPRQSLRENSSKKTKYVGCVFPFQFVNPYYHALTARSCANLLMDRSEIPQPSPDDYRVGCDCIPGFALNFQGYCIDESECTIFEAFGALVDEGKIIIPSSQEHKKVIQEHHEKAAQENQSQNIQDERDSEKPSQIIQNFFKENTSDQNKPDNIGTGEQKSDSNGNSEQEEDNDGCEEEFMDCDCSDEPENGSKTEQQTTRLLPAENSTINKSTPPLNSAKPSGNSNKVGNVQTAELEKMNQSEKKTQSPSTPNAI